MKTEFNIQPTRDGYARMAELFRESIKRHEADREIITALSLREWWEQQTSHLLNEQEITLIHDALDMLWNDKGKAIAELQRSIDDITAYLAVGEDK